jgi:hypothetical protein
MLAPIVDLVKEGALIAIDGGAPYLALAVRL